MPNFFRSIQRNTPALAAAGWFHVVLLAVAVVAAFFDSREVLGLNTWFKPIKQTASFAIYIWTIAWLLPLLPGRRWANRLIGWGTAVAISGETLIIWVQGARGVRSHFNFSSRLDVTLFSWMGYFILFSSLLALGLFFRFCRQRGDLDPALLWGIRLGFGGFFFGGFIGGLMLQHGGHTIGVSDGSAGLPFLSWSTGGGDLRIAHFLAIHAIQVLPWLGHLFSARSQKTRRISYLAAAAGLYLGLMALILAQALLGHPLLAIGQASGNPERAAAHSGGDPCLKVPASAEAVVETYGEAWVADTKTRNCRLSQAMTSDARYEDPTVSMDGIVALSGHIGRVAGPRSHIEIVGTPVLRARDGRFDWSFKNGDTEVVSGEDYVEFSEDGRLAMVTGFFRPFAAEAPSGVVAELQKAWNSVDRESRWAGIFSGNVHFTNGTIDVQGTDRIGSVMAGELVIHSMLSHSDPARFRVAMDLDGVSSVAFIALDGEGKIARMAVFAGAL